jgi:transposase
MVSCRLIDFHNQKATQDMAGKIMRMSTIKQILLFHKDGQPIKFIARHLGISKNTVKGYLAKVSTLSFTVDELVKLDDPILEACFHGGNPAYSDLRHDDLLQQLPYLAGELKKRGVTKHLLWEEYKQGKTTFYSYSQFCYHLLQHQKTLHPSMVLDHVAGDKLMIDFAGKKMSYIDKTTGDAVHCQLFIAVLPYSGYVYVEACHTQAMSDFIHCTTRCLQALGGVPKALVTDNLKSAVTKSDKYEPDLNTTFLQLNNHYGCTALPARAYKPKDKAAVEGMVRIVYTHVVARLRHRQFFSLSEMNFAIAEQVFLFNQRRLQKNEFTREEQFNASEKPVLKPLPTTLFEIQYSKYYKVAMNNHILLTPDKHYYSVPHTHIGKKVVVIFTRTIVRIYHAGTLLCMHMRDYTQGKYSTNVDHLCSHHRAYLQRSPEYYKAKALKIDPVVHQLFVLIFDQPDRYPEQLYKTCDGLLRLAYLHKSSGQFIKACSLSIQSGIINYGFIKRIIDNKMTEASIATQPELPLPKHGNIRGRDYFY